MASGLVRSPACGPAPVTVTPATSAPDITTAEATTRRRAAGGAASTSIPSSGWPTFTYSVAATHTIANDTSRCNPTIHHVSPASTVMPPRIPWKSVVAGRIHA